MRVNSTFQTIRFLIYSGLISLPVLLVFGQARTPFSFDGGTIPEFVQSIDSQFNMGGEFQELAMIHSKMNGIQVPKIRISQGSPKRALAVYDQLTERNKRLGVLNYAYTDMDGTEEIHAVSFLPADLAEPTKQRTQVFALTPKMATAIDELNARIAVPLDVLALKSEVTYSTNPEKRMLMARGSDEGLQVIQAAIDSFVKEAERKLEVIAEIQRLKREHEQMLRNKINNSNIIRLYKSKTGKEIEEKTATAEKRLVELETSIPLMIKRIELLKVELEELSK